VLFSSLLDAFGWPGGKAPGSEEYQTLNSWRSLLEQAGSLDLAAGKISCREAIARLYKMAFDIIFQPEGKEAPVQILGVLEASGLQFDHLWILGLHDGIWPASASPNPFIPLPVQRRSNLPHSSANRELEFSRIMTKHLLSIAPEVIVSHPCQEGDRDLCPSPLIKEFSEIDSSGLGLSVVKTYTDAVFESRQIENYAVSSNVPLTAGETMKGGAKIVRQQAACPFSAFAEFRLGAKMLESSSASIDARDRGILLHKAMESLWQELNSHQKLCSLSQPELKDVVTRTVEEAILNLRSKKPDSFRPEFQRLEK
jgi:ATP-dependent helicase/nuclease subunit B